MLQTARALCTRFCTDTHGVTLRAGPVARQEGARPRTAVRTRGQADGRVSG